MSDSSKGTMAFSASFFFSEDIPCGPLGGVVAEAEWVVNALISINSATLGRQQCAHGLVAIRVEHGPRGQNQVFIVKKASPL
jgi:hypothetical protein